MGQGGRGGQALPPERSRAASRDGEPAEARERQARFYIIAVARQKVGPPVAAEAADEAQPGNVRPWGATGPRPGRAHKQAEGRGGRGAHAPRKASAATKVGGNPAGPAPEGAPIRRTCEGEGARPEKSQERGDVRKKKPSKASPRPPAPTSRQSRNLREGAAGNSARRRWRSRSSASRLPRQPQAARRCAAARAHLRSSPHEHALAALLRGSALQRRSLPTRDLHRQGFALRSHAGKEIKKKLRKIFRSASGN